MASKKRYRVIAEVTISVSTVVHTASPAQAKRLAAERGMQSLCHQCASGEDDEWSTCGELDGEPHIVDCQEED